MVIARVIDYENIKPSLEIMLIGSKRHGPCMDMGYCCLKTYRNKGLLYTYILCKNKSFY